MSEAAIFHNKYWECQNKMLTILWYKVHVNLVDTIHDKIDHRVNFNVTHNIDNQIRNAFNWFENNEF